MSDASAVANDQLRSFVQRIERLEEEKKTTGDDIKDVYAEAKGVGFDTKVLRKVIALRKQDANERAEQGAILDFYLQALGMQDRSPELPMEMERVRRSERPRSGIEEEEARQAEQRRAAPIDEATVAAATAKPSKSKRAPKPKDADEARERIAANSLTFS